MLFLLVLLLMSCELEENINVLEARNSPNYVSSLLDENHDRYVEPLFCSAVSDEKWGLVRQAVESISRTIITYADDKVLKAESTSAVFGFVDDVVVMRGANRVDITSSSRVGYYDFGVNRKRVEKIREAFGKQ